MPVTIKDVARAAGVSASTVTRALTMPELVHPSTRDRVRHAAVTLGYQPNRAARCCSTGGWPGCRRSRRRSPTELLDRPDQVPRRELATQLMVRASTGPAPPDPRQKG